jgi:cytochrome c553
MAGGDRRGPLRRISSMIARPAALLPIASLLLFAAAASAAAPEDGRRKAEPCAACHGREGNATIPGTPSLAGHPTSYTHWQLLLFRNERRRDPQMTPIAAKLTDEDMADLAAYYAAQTTRARPGRPALDAATRETAERLVGTHRCSICHGPGLMGQQAVPRLVGQDEQYLRKRLGEYKAQTALDPDGFMTSAVQPLTPPDIDALARYIASLEPR